MFAARLKPRLHEPVSNRPPRTRLGRRRTFLCGLSDITVAEPGLHWFRGHRKRSGTMGTTNTLRAWMGMGVVIAGLAAGAGLAQAASGSAVEWRTSTSRLGLDPDKVQLSIGCGASLLPCRDQAQALAASNVPDVLRWTVELGAPSEPLAASRGFSGGRQGLDL